VLQEISLGIHYNVDHDLLSFVSDPAVLSPLDGFLLIPDDPGLGVAIDEDRVRRAHETRHRWRNPIWRYDDGSFAEW
jgi:galactonate dehydratase